MKCTVFLQNGHDTPLVAQHRTATAALPENSDRSSFAEPGNKRRLALPKRHLASGKPTLKLVPRSAQWHASTATVETPAGCPK